MDTLYSPKVQPLKGEARDTNVRVVALLTAGRPSHHAQESDNGMTTRLAIYLPSALPRDLDGEPEPDYPGIGNEVTHPR